MRKSVKPATAKLNGGGGGMVREKSNVTSYRSTQQRNGGSVSSKTTLTATTTNKQSVIKSPSKQLSGSSAAAAASVYASPKRTPSAEYINGSRGGSAGSYNRRLTTTLSPEESKMISHFEKEIKEMRSLEIVENCYDNDSFEEEDEEEMEGEDREGSAPSETGTYTVEEEKEAKQSKHKTEKARMDLESLVGVQEYRAHYVEDWAARHATAPPGSTGSGSRGSPRGGSSSSPREANTSPLGTKSSLSKSRRRLPATPGAMPTPASPEDLNFSPVSDSPSPNQESDEGESSYMKHTQHLVDVMEARIQKSTTSQKPGRTLVAKSSTVKKTTASRTLSNLEAGKEDAKEAWQRRKNYDPLAASGRKKDVVRKNSSSSLVGSSRDTNTPPSRGEGGSAKSGSSDSSGYFSRSDGGRFSMRGGPNKGAGGRLPTMKPQSKLLTTQSASDIKNSSRSSSSLTSKEAEFQAWKRRKNYDPLKSAAAATSTRKTSSPKSAYSPSPTPPFQPQHKRIQAMTQSMVADSSDDNGTLPMQRSASFHYENAARALAAHQRGGTSEEDSAEDYGSGCDSASQTESTPRYYLDEDELILPIYPAHSSRSVYKSISPKISPSRSRSRLEALDNLVISTIYSVSSKLCNNTSNLIRRTQQSFPPADEDQATTIETVLYLLEDVDLPSSPAKKTSRELSGTLRNLKKVEQAIEMLNKLMENDDSEAS